MTNWHAFNKSRIYHLVLQNAGKCVPNSIIFQNFLGEHAPQTPLGAKALQALARRHFQSETSTLKPTENTGTICGGNPSRLDCLVICNSCSSDKRRCDWQSGPPQKKRTQKAHSAPSEIHDKSRTQSLFNAMDKLERLSRR